MNRKLLIAILALLLVGAASAPSALAQCSQCREAAAASADGGRTMNFAIVVLLLPTLVMFVGLLIFAMSRRDSLAVATPPPAHTQEKGPSLGPTSRHPNLAVQSRQ